jgi:hypothetical protein
MIEHHESRIHGQISALLLHVHRIGVSARVVVLLKQGQIMPSMKKMGTAESGYARSYDGNLLAAHEVVDLADPHTSKNKRKACQPGDALSFCFWMRASS